MYLAIVAAPLLDSSSGWACTASSRSSWLAAPHCPPRPAHSRGGMNARVPWARCPGSRRTPPRRGDPDTGGRPVRLSAFQADAGLRAPPLGAVWLGSDRPPPSLPGGDLPGSTGDPSCPPPLTSSPRASGSTQEAHDRLEGRARPVGGRRRRCPRNQRPPQGGRPRGERRLPRRQGRAGRAAAAPSATSFCCARPRVASRATKVTNAATSTVDRGRSATTDEKFLLGSRDRRTSGLTVYSPSPPWAGRSWAKARRGRDLPARRNSRDISVEVVGIGRSSLTVRGALAARGEHGFVCAHCSTGVPANTTGTPDRLPFCLWSSRRRLPRYEPVSAGRG